MATGYPAAIDNFVDPTAGDNLNTAGVVHASLHTNVNDAINAIETELGTNPKGSALSVKDRLNAIDTALAARSLSADEGTANGIATLDASSMLVQNVDAGKMTTGTLNAGRIPNLDAGKITTGSFAAARIPSLDASKVTSGAFDAARIPSLDASKITTGVFNAARIPSTVTANANSRVVADVAGMNAIPVGERVNGMLVTVLTPFTLYAWRSDNSTWNQIGGPGEISEPLLTAREDTDLTTSTTTFAAGAPGLSQVFVAPQSGKVRITYTLHGASAIGSSAGTAFVYFGGDIRTGNVIGSGTLIRGAATEDCAAIGGNSGVRMLASRVIHQTGLTPGNTYHVRTLFIIASSGTGNLFSREVTVEMMH
jgi:hypothetical protein